MSEANENTKSPEERVGEITREINRSERRVRRYQAAILRLAALLLILWVLFFQIIGLTHVPNGDMAPRMDAGDLVLFYRLDTDVRAQDVIVVEVETPDNPGVKTMYVGRVIAVGGDTVEIGESERVVVNGNTLIESNIYYSTPAYEGYTEYPLTLGQDECFVLVDSRYGGTDSRYYGPVAREDIVGTVITVVRRNNL